MLSGRVEQWDLRKDSLKNAKESCEKKTEAFDIYEIGSDNESDLSEVALQLLWLKQK